MDEFESIRKKECARCWLNLFVLLPAILLPAIFTDNDVKLLAVFPHECLTMLAKHLVGKAMALKPCKECGKEISTDARRCPSCGVSNPTTDTGAGCLGLIIFSLLLGGIIALFNNFACGKSPEVEDKKVSDHVLMAKATENLKLKVFDPDALQIRALFVNGESVCGWYNGKNLVGAYVGWRRFLFDEDMGRDAMLLAIALGEVDASSGKAEMAGFAVFKEEDDPQSFADLWVFYCEKEN